MRLRWVWFRFSWLGRGRRLAARGKSRERWWPLGRTGRASRCCSRSRGCRVCLCAWLGAGWMVVLVFWWVWLLRACFVVGAFGCWGVACERRGSGCRWDFGSNRSRPPRWPTRSERLARGALPRLVRGKRSILVATKVSVGQRAGGQRWHCSRPGARERVS
jgi:hypothetical protein